MKITNSTDEAARQLIKESKSAADNIQYLVDAVKSRPKPRERQALQAALDRRLTRDHRREDRRLLDHALREVRSAVSPRPPTGSIMAEGPNSEPTRTWLKRRFGIEIKDASAAPAVSSVPPASTAVTAPLADPAVTAAAATVRDGLDKIAQAEHDWAAARIPPSQDPDDPYYTKLHSLHLKIIDRIVNIEDVLTPLDPAQKKALVEEMSPAELKSLAFYEGSIQGYVDGCSARPLTELGRSAGSPGPSCDPALYYHLPEPVFGDLVAASTGEARTFAKVLNAYQTASQSAQSLAFSVTSWHPSILPGDGRAALLNAHFTPDYHANMVRWGQDFIDRHAKEPGVLRDLVANLAPVITRNVTYPVTMRRGAGGELQPTWPLGDARGVIIANAIKKIKETGDTDALATAFAWLRVSNPSSHPILSAADLQKVPVDVLESVAFAAARWSRTEYMPDASEFSNSPMFDLTEAARAAMTRAALSEDDLAGLKTNHLLIGAEPEPLLGLIEAVKAPYFLPEKRMGGYLGPGAQDAALVRGTARAQVINAVTKAALADAAYALSTKDDAVFALDVANNEDAHKVVLALDGLLADHPSVTLAAMRSLDRMNQRGETLSLLMLMHYNREMLLQLHEYDPSKDAVSQIPLFRQGGPLYPVALQLWHGDGMVAPAVLDEQWEDEATRFWLSGQYPLDPHNWVQLALGRKNLGYFIGAFTGTQYLAGTVFAQMRERRDRGRRAPTNLVREATSLFSDIPFIGKLSIPAKSILAWNMEQRSFEVLVERDQQYRIFEGQQTAAGEQDGQIPGVERVGIPTDASLKRVMKKIYGNFVTVLRSPAFADGADGTKSPAVQYQDAVTAGQEYGKQKRELGGYQRRI
jgi:hypothetical protein